MTLEIKMITLGLASTNCYIIGDTETKDAILIDPVDDAQLLYNTATDAGWTIKHIFATHGHFDHVLASKALKDLTTAPFYIHEDALPFLERLPETGMRFIGKPFPEAAQPDEFLSTESETIDLGAITLKTLYTPGHAPGHISFYMDSHKILFSGDTLFKGSIGRTDLPGSNHDVLMQSIMEKLMKLDDDVQVLAGHLPPTTIGQERRTNPFLLGYQE